MGGWRGRWSELAACMMVMEGREEIQGLLLEVGLCAETAPLTGCGSEGRSRMGPESSCPLTMRWESRSTESIDNTVQEAGSPSRTLIVQAPASPASPPCSFLSPTPFPLYKKMSVSDFHTAWAESTERFPPTASWLSSCSLTSGRSTTRGAASDLPSYKHTCRKRECVCVCVCVCSLISSILQGSKHAFDLDPPRSTRPLR